ncbi:MAG: hypothetical protein GWN00_35745, partial [Aliifodinibius sp.]|nr:hypothetical protein [Fodinibius sp.]NIV15984.1 hypothetical protein [Fodinibius sp.]NIY29951.1 hypothetical protein [Fodinibius sp.]
MKWLQGLFVYFFLAWFLPRVVLADVFFADSVEYRQPNDVPFIGQIWGDEFLNFMEADDGYRFVQGEDGYYYYAVLDAEGKLVPGNNKVAIDPPPAESYQLMPSYDYLDYIEQKREDARVLQQQALIWFKQKQSEARAQGRSVKLKIGILLAEFADWQHYTTDPSHPLGDYRPDGYYIDDFEKMFFSNKNNPNYNWYEPDPNPPSDPSPHPEGDKVFGSLHDYWWEVSRGAIDSVGALRVIGEVINPPNDTIPEVPQWIAYDSTMHYYDTNGGFVEEAIYKAKLNGWINYNDLNDPFDFQDFDRIVVVYSYFTPRDDHLWPAARSKNGKGIWWCGERDWQRFKHIGIHAHEFGHTIGLPDEYEPLPNGDYLMDFFDIMNGGAHNGPPGSASNVAYDRGQCPALISPYYRIDEYKWSNAIEIENDTTNLLVEYDYTNPKYYRVTTQSDTDKYFYIENRRRKNFDLWTPFDPSDTTQQGGWLLVWKVEKDLPSPVPVQRKLEFVPADGELNDNYYGNIWKSIWDFYPTSKYGLPALTQDLNDETFPSTNLSNGELSFVSINNIRKDSLNPKIMKVDINRNYGITYITGQETWSGDVYRTEFMIIVDSGGVLNIEPGSDIYIDRKDNSDYGAKIIVENGGTLNAMGTENEQILFHSEGITKYDWKGLVLENGGEINLEYCFFKHADTALKIENIDDKVFSNIEIDSCNVGIKFSGSDNMVSNSQFKYLATNLEFCGRRNVITECSFFGGKIIASYSDTLSEIRNSIFSNESMIILRDSSFFSIRENVFQASSIEFEKLEYIYGSQSTIVNNLMIGSQQGGIGIDLPRYAIINPSIINNTISNYEFGIYCRGNTSQPLIKNNILYLNEKTADENGGLYGEGSAIYNDIFNLDQPIGLDTT